MNEGFFLLQEERKEQIINAGFYVFSQNSYKKSPVSEIAARAGISKALLFYHFKNKQELYLFLWNKVLELIKEETANQKVLEGTDYFEMLSRTLKGKCNMMRKYPYAMEFSMRAYYEQEKEIAHQIQKSFKNENIEGERKVLERINCLDLKEGIDYSLMYREMIWAAEGYMKDAMLQGELNPDKIEMEFEKIIEMWKLAYSKEV